jgi:hypothetical protein
MKESQWRPILEDEQKLIAHARAEVDRLERIINAAQRILVLKGAPGFQQFEQAVTDLRAHAQNEMVGCVAGNEQLRILQGRCQAFSSILTLMRNTEHNIQTLATQLATAKEKAAAIIRPDGKVTPEPVGGLR